VSKLLSALGLMSGTSLDGIDVALIKTDGGIFAHRGPARTYPYSDDQRAMLREAIAEAAALTDRRARPGCLAAIEWALTDWHAAAVRAFREDFNLTDAEIDIVGFHGQTVLHRPGAHLTVQLGDGASLARQIGKPVVYDLRAADVAVGGQGAPLVPIYHWARAFWIDRYPIAFVNIGGLANLTWIGADDRLIAFDTGPGNGLLNDWCERHVGEPMDRDGALAARGVLDKAALTTLAQHPYFEKPPPKSLDRNAFDLSCLAGLSPADGAATLTQFTAASIARAPAWLPERPKLWVITGGGRRNPVLMEAVRGLFEPLGEEVLTAEQAGFDGDAMEAEAWAYLAVRSLKDLPITFPGTTGVPQPLPGGVLAEP
jgi:anhydro-N-acetylmuramic acid kinase